LHAEAAAQESTPPLVVAAVTQPVPTPGTAEVLLSPTPAVQTPAGRADRGPDLQWTEGSNSARESAAATAVVLVALGPVNDNSNTEAETASRTLSAQAAAGDETCMVEPSALTSTVAEQLQCSVSAAVCGPDTEVASLAACAAAVERGCGGACPQSAAVNLAALPAVGTAAAAAVYAPLAAEERVLTAAADDPDFVLEAGKAAALVSASGLVTDASGEPGADVLYSSAAAMIAAVADGIASKLQVCLLLWHCAQHFEQANTCPPDANSLH